MEEENIEIRSQYLELNLKKSLWFYNNTVKNS